MDTPINEIAQDIPGMFQLLEEINFRALFDAAAVAMLIVNGNGRIVLSNSAARQLLGYSMEQLDGLTVEALMPQRYREEHRLRQKAFFRQPENRPLGNDLELYVLTAEGAEIPVDISLSPIKTNEGELFTLVTIRSIAKRRKMEHELHISEERLRLAADAAHFGMFDADLVAGKLYWSPEMKTIVGLSPDTPTPALGEEFNYLHPDETERVRALLRSAYGSGGSGEVEDEQRIVRPDGSVRWLLVKGKARFSGEGEARRAVRATGVALDITRRKEMEIALKSSETLFRTMVDSSLIPIGVSRLSDGIFVKVNEAFLNMYGYTRDEIIGHTSLELKLWNDAEQRRKMYATMRTTGRIMGEEFSFTTKSGKFGSGIYSASRIMLNGEPHVMGFLMDMTEQKHLEKEVQVNRKEMATLQQLQIAAQTVAAIAHELNQPLLAIASYSEAVLMMLKAGNPNLDKISQAVKASERQTHRAGEIIHELLEFLNIKEFTTEVFDLNREITGILAIAESEHDVWFQSVLQLEKELPPVQANRIHVQKVLLNLLHNSIEAMQEAGIPMPAITVTVRTRKDESVAQVTIQDNGPGFKKEDVPYLFEPFFTTKDNGIGMGLVISRSLVEANGGQLWVDPEEGPGAVFHLTLPFAP
jgi:PAS domain S-box-containing protein